MRLDHFPEAPLEFGDTVSYEVFDPVYGLERLGPYDANRERSFHSLTVAVVGPQSRKEAFGHLWASLVNGVPRVNYEPKFEGGFSRIYRLDRVELPAQHKGFIAIDNFQASSVEEKYVSALRYVRSNCAFDVLYIIEPEQPIYYLHDLLRRECVEQGIYAQYLEADTLTKGAQGSVLHNIAVATYAKAGGVPWQLRQSPLANTLVLGLSFHLVRARDSTETHRTIVGVAEVLDEFGRHLAMQVSRQETSTEAIQKFKREYRSLYVPKGLMENLVKYALRPTQWPGRQLPKRLVVHKTTPFHEEEITGLQAALEDIQADLEFALVHIKEETVQRVYRESDKLALRGLLLTLRDDIPESVLWTVGKVPQRWKQGSEYKYGEKSGSKIGTSDPIAIHLSKASRCPGFNVTDASRQVFALTKMRWNTVEMSIRLPVSIYLARQVGHFITAAQRHDADMSFANQVSARYFW